MRSGANGAEPATTTNCGDRVRQMPRKRGGVIQVFEVYMRELLIVYYEGGDNVYCFRLSEMLLVFFVGDSLGMTHSFNAKSLHKTDFSYPRSHDNKTALRRSKW